jgi:hypothetical protein
MTTSIDAAAIAAITYRPGTVAHHHGDFVYPGRRVVNGVWPYLTPEACRDEQPGGIWIGTAEHEVLICLGCGLDAT